MMVMLSYQVQKASNYDIAQAFDLTFGQPCFNVTLIEQTTCMLILFNEISI